MIFPFRVPTQRVLSADVPVRTRPRSRLSIRLMADRFMSKSTWLYVSSVMEIRLCPSISCTTFAFSPSRSKMVANVCRNAPNPIGGNPAWARNR